MRSARRSSRTVRGTVPKFLGYDNPNSRVVCRPESRNRIEKMPAGKRKQLNLRLLQRCEFGSIQDAINSIKKRKTSIYVLPGLYEERKYAGDERTHYCSHLGSASRTPLQSSEYIGSISNTEEPPTPDGLAARADETNPIGLSYADQVKCPHNLNLIALFGDQSPRNKSIRCDSRFCGTQIVGTGIKMTDVHRRQPVQEAQRDPPGPGGRLVPVEHDLPAGRVQLGLRARDRRVRAGPADHPRQRRVRHPRVRQRPRPDPAHEQLLQRRLGHLPRLGLGPQRAQQEAEGQALRDRDPQQPQPRQHAGLLRHGRKLDLGPPQQVLQQRHGHRDGLPVPRPPGTSAGPRPVELQRDLQQQRELLHEVRRQGRLRQADGEARLHSAAPSAR